MSLRCPKCYAPLHQEGKSYLCAQHHTYDIAKGGYVNLVLNNRKATGDDKGMVDARSEFLLHGYYTSLQKALCDVLAKLQPTHLVDAGCGQGYYTNAFQDVVKDCQIYGFDLSKFALKEACKAHNAVHYAAASVADVPLDDACADAWISVFAPIYIEEVNRILKQDGIFIKVGPGPKHLYELKQELYDDVYDNECDMDGYDGYKLLERRMVEDNIHITNNTDVQALFQMTPYYYRSPKDKVEALKKKTELKTRLQFLIEVYQKV